ncbi:hypothetical protein ACH4FX_38785 [Streptomyces sp. NPDC018019]|uniref:hypothetical protein n=1 Tax=Streptomyces sp. NPDC018019 TaxID=3365030 RepID=UPI0037B8920D
MPPVLDAVAADPDIGRPLAGNSLREYEQGGVRVIYYTTTLGTIIVVAYVEV